MEDLVDEETKFPLLLRDGRPSGWESEKRMYPGTGSQWDFGACDLTYAFWNGSFLCLGPRRSLVT